MKRYYNAYKKTYATEEEMLVWLQTEWRYEDGKLYRLADNSRPNFLRTKASTTLCVRGFRVEEHYAVWLFFGLFSPEEGELDHIDRDPTNNRIENLRVATRHQQSLNRASFRGSSSKYKGVYWKKREQAWVAEIQYLGKSKTLKQCKSEDEAARIYNKAALELHGEFAVLNMIEGDS